MFTSPRGLSARVAKQPTILVDFSHKASHQEGDRLEEWAVHAGLISIELLANHFAGIVESRYLRGAIVITIALVLP